jgi:hypothetical protein
MPSSLFGTSTIGGVLFGGPFSLPPDKGLVDIVRQLLDEASGSVFWPNDQVYDACNDVILDLWANTRIQVAEVDLVVTSNVDLYPMPALMIPQFVVLNTTIGSVVINEKYWITDQAKLEQWSRVWRRNSLQQPKFFVPFGLTQLRVWPKPDITYTFQVWGVPWPTEMNGDNRDAPQEDLLIDRQLKLAIAFRAAANLLESTRPDMTDVFNRESDDCIARYKIRLRNRQKHNIHRLRPNTGSGGMNKTIAAYKGVINIGRRLP